jgi:multidrug resistance efflux pump
VKSHHGRTYADDRRPDIGEIRLKSDGGWRGLAATNGYAEIGPGADHHRRQCAEWPEQIDLARAKAAQERAEKRYHDPRTSAQERNHARHGIERAKARIKIQQKYAASSPHPPQTASDRRSSGPEMENLVRELDQACPA